MRIQLYRIYLAGALAVGAPASAQESRWADRFVVDPSPPDCAEAHPDIHVIDDFKLRFPIKLKTETVRYGFSVSLNEEQMGDVVTLIEREAFRDATAVMTEQFPNWISERFVATIRGTEWDYVRSPDPHFSSGLDMLAPIKTIPANLYFLRTTTNRVMTLIACPFNPFAVTPMMWCTLFKADSDGVGYEITFGATYLSLWQEVEAVAKDLIADAQTCGQS